MLYALLVDLPTKELCTLRFLLRPVSGNEHEYAGCVADAISCGRVFKEVARGENMHDLFEKLYPLVNEIETKVVNEIETNVKRA